MGTTFSTVQIRNPHQTEPEQFKKLLCGYFEKKGLVPATEDDFQFSYWLAFSRESNWMTLGSSGYSLDEVCAEVVEIAKNLNTHCILTNVWDSDFLELKLFGSTDMQNDTIVTGSPLAEEMLAGGRRKRWEPLLAEGKTWNQLTEICKTSHTFAEDALYEIAPILGMDPKSLTMDYNCCEEVSSNIPNVVDLYFKKASQLSVRKAASLDKVFKQVFGEALAPLGFVKIKGRQPYFVRLIGDEILHVVTYRKEQCFEQGYKGFDIMGGVATVYRRRISLDKSPSDNLNWIDSACGFYQKKVNPSSIDDELYKSIYMFCYKVDNDESMLYEVKRSLEITKQFMLPVLNKVTDLDSCIEYFYKYRGSMRLHDSLDFKNYYYYGEYEEGLLLIKTNNRDDGIERMKRGLDRTAQLMKEGRCGYSQKDYEEYCKECEEARLRQIATRNKFIDNPEWHTKVIAELEKRKSENTEILRSYGFDL